MADPEQKPRRILRRNHLIYGSLLLLAFLCAAWYFTSDSFRDYIRDRLIAQLNEATGGQVEVRRLEWNLARLRVRIEGLTIRGLEGPAEAPLLHVNTIDAHLRIISFFSREIAFRSLDLDSPSVNLIVYSDGRTNQPTPRNISASRPGNGLDPIFLFAIRRFVMKNGLLHVNQQKIPFDLQANDVNGTLEYNRTPAFYAANLKVGKFDTHWRDRRPFASLGTFDFRLYHDKIEIRSAQIASGNSQFWFAGTLANFVQPRVNLTYRAKLDLHETGAILRLSELEAGHLESAGSARFDGIRNEVSGKIQITDGAWIHPSIHASGISGTADFTLDQDRLQLSHIAANALGGSVSGDLAVAYWNAPRRVHTDSVPSKSHPTGHVLAVREQKADGKFVVRDLQVERIAAMFATPRLPLTQLHVAGLAEGTVGVSWTGSIEQTELRLDVRAVPESGNVPVTAHVSGLYTFRNYSLQIEQAELQTPGSHLNATGVLGASHLDLEVGMSSSNLRELEPLLAANGYVSPRLKISGEGSFRGAITGRTAMPDINGHLQLADFTTLIEPEAPNAEPELIKALHKKSMPRSRVPEVPAASKPVTIHWDSFDGYVTYGPNAASVRSGILRSGSARFDLAGNTTLQNGQFTNLSQFRLTSKIHDARVQDLQTLMGVNFPVTGTVSLEMDMSGTRLDPHGSGKLTMVDGSAYGEPLQTLSTDLTFSGREARFENLRAQSNAAQAQGSGFLNVTTEQFGFDVRGSGVDLLRFPLLQTQKVKLTGTANVHLKGSGTLSMPMVDGDATIHNISLGGKHEGDLKIEVATHGEQMQLRASSQFVTASLSASGSVHLRGNFDSDITAKFANVDLQPFLVGLARGHSSIDGTLHITGPLLQPVKLDARLEIPRYESEVESVALRNSGPIVATYHDGTVNLQSFRLTGEATDLSSSGSFRLIDGQTVNMRADGRANLRLLQSFDPEIVSYGQTNVSVQVGGTLHDPALRGRLTIEHAGIAYVDMPNGLSDLNGAFVFNENRLQVEKLTAHTGGGDLAIAGFIAYGRTVSFNLTATGKEIRIRYPEGVSANGDADLRLAGTLKNATLSGQITINKFGLNPRFDFAYYLTRSRQLPTVPNPDSPLNNLHFDVHVVSTPELQVQTSLAKITGDVDLHLRGTGIRPSVLGRITIVEGDVTFNGTKYRLDRGDILFTNPAKIDPVLDLEASARVSDYDISIGLHGTVDKLNTSYRSDPPLPTADVFALLAFGRTTELSSTTPETSAYTESASSAVLGSALNAAVSSRVQKLFGASRIKIDPEVGGAENNPNARITVEQQVSGNITLTYITNLAQSAQQVIQFQYNVNRNVSIVGVRDEYGVVGFEVQVRQRKR